ncbi:MAG TPA: hypothetical protein VGD67_26725 [Pseudonocardiaceae bacterium]
MRPDGRDVPARPEDQRGDSGRVVAWAPGLTGIAAEAPRNPVDSPFGTRDPGSFAELDLVITPVSVTPPSTWRRAAWFTVGASCVVLTVLVFAAARLAGPESPFDRIDAFPGLPTGGLLTAQPIGPQVTQPDTPARTVPGTGAEPGSPGGAPDQRPRTGSDAVGAEQGDPPDGGPAGPGPDPRPASTSEPGGPNGASTSPSVSLVPSTGRPPVGADDLVSATRLFYEQLPKNVDAAWAMVGPRVRVMGYEAFHKQWSAAQVSLQKVVVDAGDSSVLSTVRFVTTDGLAYTQRFRMVFRMGSSLIIEEILLLPDAGNEPVR